MLFYVVKRLLLKVIFDSISLCMAMFNINNPSELRNFGEVSIILKISANPLLAATNAFDGS